LSETGVILNIQRFSIHDGPGIRTTVFFKGCTLRCFWCHNPESIRPQPEIQFFPDRCIGCGECLAVCPQGAHEFEDDHHTYARHACIVCGQCVDVCYAAAVELTGRAMTVDEVMAEVLQDEAFYASSGGGVTLSGGEPVLQRDFAHALLAGCKARGLHTAIETAANCRWEDLAALLPVTDLIMMDVKHMDPNKHKEATGVSNRRILDNARRLASTGKPILFRTPVVPTVNDTPQEIAAIAQFVQGLVDLGSRRSVGQTEVNGHCHGTLPDYELLPFHRLASDKYRSLDLDYRASRLDPPSQELMAELVDVASGYGITVRGR
jgi:pyruvate formate lyase activating enzyme